MMKKWIAGIVSGLVLTGAGFAEDVSTADEEAAFEQLVLKIKEDSLNGKEVKKLGFDDEVDDKIDIEYDGFVYVLEFRNRSAIALNDVKVECRFFYTEESTWHAKQLTTIAYNTNISVNGRSKSEQKYYEDSLDVSLSVGARYKAETRPFILESRSLASGWYYESGEADKVESDSIGLWVRISYKTSSGDTVTRDICEPESLSSNISWEGKSI